MKSKQFFTSAGAGLLCLISLSTRLVHAQSTSKPNIIFILADDLGYRELGSYGQKVIRTPNLDRMAAEGIRFTRHYAGNAVCAPSRCVLLTGKHPGHAEIRDNREVQPEGQFSLTKQAVTIAMALKKTGYVTGAFGKWGLGGPGSDGDPTNQGFDTFFGYNCQRKAHNYYPTYLWSNREKFALNNPEFPAYQKFPVGKDANDPENYKAYVGKDYSPDLIAEHARRFVKENAKKSFFLYYPTTVPHVALQVPNDSIAEYEGKIEDKPYLGNQGYLPQRTPHAAYAGMITRMDKEVGRLMDLVKELNLDKNTIFVFTSDNGPVYERIGGADSAFFKSAGDLNGLKGSLYEGGIRIPMIMRWVGKIPARSVSDRISGFEDWFPTFMQVAGVSTQGLGLDGFSLLETGIGKKQDDRPFLYREFPDYGGQQAVWQGKWKAIRQHLTQSKKAGAPTAVIKTELYDLSLDEGEKYDVASQHPDIVATLEKVMRTQHVPSKKFAMPLLDAETTIK